MQITLSTHMMQSIDQTVSHYTGRTELLDIYQAAGAIQKLHPNDNVALEDIIAEILKCVGANVAISFVPSENEIGIDHLHATKSFSPTRTSSKVA